MPLATTDGRITIAEHPKRRNGPEGPLHARSLVGAAGFEPTTTSPPDWCATRLRHAPSPASLHRPGRAADVRLSQEATQIARGRGQLVRDSVSSTLVPT